MHVWEHSHPRNTQRVILMGRAVEKLGPTLLVWGPACVVTLPYDLGPVEVMDVVDHTWVA